MKIRILSLLLLMLVLAYSLKSEEQVKPVVQGFMEKSFQHGMNLQDTRAALQLWLEKMYRDMLGKFNISVASFKTLEEVVTALQKGTIDIVSCNGLDYIRIMRQVSTEVCFLGITGGSVYENYVLITGDKVKDIKSLQGKELLLNCMSRYEQAQMWLDLYLNSQGLPPSDKFFSKINRVKKIEQSVLPLYFGKQQCCFTIEEGFNLMCELNPQLKQKLKILAKSPEYIRNFTAFRTTFDNQTGRDVGESAFKLDKDAVGKQILLLFGLEKGVPFKPEYTGSLEKLEDDYLSVFKKPLDLSGI